MRQEKSGNRDRTRRLTADALLAGVALIIFAVESLIPPVVPIPGVKLGLANIVTVFAMFLLGPKDTLAILLCRIVLGNLLGGQIMSFLFSVTGGIFCYLIMLVLRKTCSEKQIWVCSVIGAVFHNIGQILVAMLVLQTAGIVVYLPFLMLSGIIAGLFTGLAAQLLVDRFRKTDLYRQLHGNTGRRRKRGGG